MLLLAPFGMLVKVSPGEDMAFQSAQLANALVGAVESYASRAEDAYRRQGASPEELIQARLPGGAAGPHVVSS